MIYEDAEIVKRQMKEQQEQINDIYSEYVWAGSEKLTFRSTYIFDKKLELMLPDTYKEMEKNYVKIKYPLSQPPQIIKTNKDGTVNFCFSIFKDGPFYDSQVEKGTITSFGALKSFNAQIQLMEKNIIEVDKKTVGYFGFKSPGMDMELFQIFAIMSINNYLFQFIFNCPFAHSRSWNPLVLQVIQSIKEV